MSSIRSKWLLKRLQEARVQMDGWVFYHIVHAIDRESHFRNIWSHRIYLQGFEKVVSSDYFLNHNRPCLYAHPLQPLRKASLSCRVIPLNLAWRCRLRSFSARIFAVHFSRSTSYEIRPVRHPTLFRSYVVRCTVHCVSRLVVSISPIWTDDSQSSIYDAMRRAVRCARSISVANGLELIHARHGRRISQATALAEKTKTQTLWFKPYIRV